MGYVEDETREKQRADLRELGGTLREFAELEARRRNWGPAQRRLGLAMSAWQFFVIRRRHGRFLAKERAPPGPGPRAPEAPPPAASDDDGGDDEPARAALPLPSWEWYTSLRSTHGSSWGRAPRLSQYPSWSGPRRPRRKGKRSRGVRPLSSYRKLAPRGRDDPDGDFKDLAHDKFAVYALTWPPKRAAGFHRAGRKAFGAAANRVNNRKTILAAGSFSTVEYVTKTSTSPRGREARVTLKPADDFDRVVAA
ncbi:hypothetical protein JL720_3001 [Aureococcus anophagefferens]|nr:hypothetical protein JL720_3001 [Aureococcus anophagefferens]